MSKRSKRLLSLLLGAGLVTDRARGTGLELESIPTAPL